MAEANKRLAETLAHLPQLESSARARLEELEEAIRQISELAEDTRRSLEQVEPLERAVSDLSQSAAVLAEALEPLESMSARLGRIRGRGLRRAISRPDRGSGQEA